MAFQGVRTSTIGGDGNYNKNIRFMIFIVGGGAVISIHGRMRSSRQVVR